MNSQFPNSFNCKFITDSRIYEGEELNTISQELAQKIIKRLVSASPFIYLYGLNNIKTILYYIAILKSGHIPVIIDPGTTQLELLEFFNVCYPSAIIRPEEFNLNFEGDISVFEPSSTSRIDSDVENVAAMFFTNAEDGFYKLAMISFENLLFSAKATIETDEGILEHGKICTLSPFSHIWGFVTGVIIPIVYSLESYITDLSDILKFERKLKRINELKITHIYSVPMLYFLMLKVHRIDYLLKDSRMLCSGGQKLSSDLFMKFHEKTNHYIYEGYGLTESTGIAIANNTSFVPNGESLGKKTNYCTVKIHKENKTITNGEICLKGKCIVSGYFNNQQATNHYFRDGYLHTGDLGFQDKDGLYYFVGLKKKMFNVSGYNVYPDELKRLLMKSNMLEHCLISSEISKIGNHIITCQVSLKSHFTLMQLKKWANSNISSFKLPKKWQEL